MRKGKPTQSESCPNSNVIKLHQILLRLYNMFAPVCMKSHEVNSHQPCGHGGGTHIPEIPCRKNRSTPLPEQQRLWKIAPQILRESGHAVSMQCILVSCECHNVCHNLYEDMNMHFCSNMPSLLLSQLFYVWKGTGWPGTSFIETMLQRTLMLWQCAMGAWLDALRSLTSCFYWKFTSKEFKSTTIWQLKTKLKVRPTGATLCVTGNCLCQKQFWAQTKSQKSKIKHIRNVNTQNKSEVLDHYAMVESPLFAVLSLPCLSCLQN